MTARVDHLTNYTGAFVDELAQNGVTDVIISPGSRSTPLALLFCNHTKIQSHILIDERSAGFFALGIAKAKKQPVVLLCTSGSAAANYYPAVVEAFHSQVPVLIVTSDRPHELRDAGAPQAMNQMNMYGNFTHYFTDMALPENTIEQIEYARSVVRRAVSIGRERKGPVQINMPFREPLLPDLEKEDRFTRGRRKETMSCGSLFSESITLSHKIKEEWNRFEKVIVVAGDMQNESNQKELIHLCNRMNIPLLADPLSQLRSGDVIDSYDLFLRYDEIQQQLKPDCIIRIGAYPVSKVLGQFLQKQHTVQWYIGERELVPDPIHKVTTKIECSPLLFFKELVRELPKKKDYENKWKKVQAITAEFLHNYSTNLNHEGLVIREVLQNIKKEVPIFVANSMPIRDVDLFLRGEYEVHAVYANRGVNGIDGLVSTALGVASAYEECVLISGDLSFYHDLNGLLAAKKYNLSLKIILINNDGGGIFSFLPQAKQETYFEELYGTPIDVPFEPIITAYGGRYEECTSTLQLQSFLNKKESGLAVIEIKTNRKENYEAHQTVTENMQALLSGIEL